ncbi:acyl-CoA dehydrogenase family protein [Hyphomonas sp. UBA5107]|uniref:acyl-CoA dehydrogenase family protein n=1 Tax=Hyphomonas sp. UBA5107 TaxID=1946636 RepID=UPI0025BEFA0B|nr:acyl-CoA dehydrogenase family protein [Hyphomonas sp. UBA5107]|tara:strand:- start:45874 stop:47052 length:1179 start_codon:yes stop_codon:yes gene_type:complete
MMNKEQDRMNPGIESDVFDQLLEMVRRFTEERLMPAEALVEETDDIPEDIVQEIRDLGLFGISIPEIYGGIGLNMAQETLVIETLCNASLAFRSLIGTTVGIGSQGLVMDGTEAQKQAFLPRLASGEIISSFALTEPDHGSDAAHIQTTARRDGDDFIINGTKRYITNASRAGMFTLLARTDPDKEGASGVTAFLMPADAPGISFGKTDKKMGQRGTRTCDVMLDNVRLPASAIIGGPDNLGKGFYTAMKVLDRGRIHLSAVAVGTSQRMINIATDYARERKQFGVPIGQHQLVQALLADSQTDLLAARHLCRAAARKYDAEGSAVLEASCSKLFASEAAGRIADRCVQIHGGAGYIADYQIERLYRDVRLLRIYEGTSQIQQIIIARNMLK